MFASPRFYVANLGREVYFPGSFRMARQHIRPLPRRRLPQGAVIPNLGAGLPSRAALRGRPPSTLAPSFPSGRCPNPSGQRPFCVCPPFDGASPASASPISAGSASVIRALSPAGHFREKVLQSASDIMSALLVEIAGKVPMGGC